MVSSATMKIEAQPYASIHTQTTSKGKLTMRNLLLNSLAVHHSRTFLDLKKERPDQTDLLVGKHNVGETVMAQKQATGSPKKYRTFARYLHGIFTRPTTRASSKQPAHQKIPSKCPVFARYHNPQNYEHKEHTLFYIPCLIDNRKQKRFPSLRIPYPPSPFP